MSFGGVCPCCYRHDGLTSGGCTYCTMRTHCAACGRLLSCGCGHKIEVHACPNVTVVGTTMLVPTLPLAGGDRVAR